MAIDLNTLQKMFGWGPQNPQMQQGINPGAYDAAMAVGGGTPSTALMGGNQMATPSGGGWGGMLGSTDTETGIKTDGWGGLALGAAQGLGGAYLGMKQYGLAKDQFDESKRQFNVNFDTQKGLTNSRLEDRQAARVASNPGAYQSVGDYMKKNGVK